MGVSSSKKVNPRPQIPGDWDVDKIPSQKGKVAIVTGANSGIGYEVVLVLALKGAFVVLACRNGECGQEAEATLHETLSTTAGAGSIVFMQVDMGDLSSVHQFCEEFKKKCDRLDLLVNNAGIVGGAYTQSVDGPSQKGKVAIVTGANSGLGFETALELARKGAHVVLACRNELKGTETETKLRAQLTNEPNSGTFQFMKLDVSDLSSVKMFVAEFMKTHNRLDLLINNAGVMGGSYALTVDGYERLFATNHLGHFALTAQLFELLQKSALSRVVNVSSGLHHRADRSFNEDEIMVTREENFGQVQTYSESKLCNILFTKELDRRLQAAGVEGVVAVSCHPGYVATNLGTNMAAANSNWLWWIVISIATMLPGGKSPEVGALPILYAATGDEVVGGDYIGSKEKLKNVGNPARPEPSELSMSESAASKLWAFSEKLAHVDFRVVKTDVGE
ncbi:hypothetical protein BBO99_00004883 [Phytophthora kernoviae]|uniref:Uncharacterized protein n=2 Tax=Phytophthora kernoviae TaxID=325452 RepID=A0A421EV99_9STRA|nr:hypothetical protein G195_005965 [Phytophthora kernoviae 00238/432]KAG2525071.1 hypothetical protein JM16_004710 [Phytophthora kernoviae]KAG2525470.1 hypothetical protein JM18_003546 [Phytophthora kernoviae]RLN02833.1 hypothetical protein BBI17_004959 [Phytophthora kernoviae]RLN79945.1 hypothetical protein BBO99_00004883 [Phytophthora kernoviae]